MMRWMAAIAIVLSAAGCQYGYSARKLTLAESSYSELKAGMHFVLLKPVLVANHTTSPQTDYTYFPGYDLTTRTHVDGDPLGYRDPLAYYELHKHEHTMYEGVLTAGTHIQFSFLGLIQVLGNGPMDYAFGEVLDGPFAGKKIQMDGLAGPGTGGIHFDQEFLRPE